MGTLVRIILWSLIIVSGLYLLCITTVEGFEGGPSELDIKEEALRNEIISQVTLLNDKLCPIYKSVVDIRTDTYIGDFDSTIEKSREKSDNNQSNSLYYMTNPFRVGYTGKRFAYPDPRLQSERNTGEQKGFKCRAKAEAIHSIKSDTQGLLFPCPPPAEPMDIPNNVDAYIVNTSIIFILFAAETKKKIEDSLSKACTNQGFVDSGKQPIQQTPPKPQTPPEEDECAPKKKKIVNDDPTLQIQRIQVLQIKLDALKKGLSSKEYLMLLDKFKELMELKSKAESGQLAPNCPA
jgi:hypothetical protein